MADKYEDEILEGEVSDDDDQEENKKEPEKYCTLCHRAERESQTQLALIKCPFTTVLQRL